ncbi:MAG TPA: hypothetical protein VFI96_07130 [Longimicrobiaceae bacterium]|nr:hypothetical protein [Longimicrobiaceae bacterium]
MASPRPRPTSPERERLLVVRRALLRLHKTLIDSERRVFESQNGALTNSQFLQKLLEDPFFNWLRPYSGLIVQMDEAMAADEPLDAEALRDFLAEAHAVAAPEEGSDAAERLHAAQARDPMVRAAQAEAMKRIAEASAEG